MKRAWDNIINWFKKKKYLRKAASFLCTPWMGLFLGEVLFFCFGLVAVVEKPSVTDILISIGCLIWITFLTTYTLMRISKKRKRLLIYGVLLIAIILFLATIYRPYTYDVRLLVMFALFCGSVFFLVHMNQKKWIMVVLCIAGEIVDSRYVCMMFLPLMLMHTLLSKKEKTYTFFLGKCLCAQFLVGVAKTVIVKEDVKDLFFAESSELQYTIPYWCLFILSYLCTYLLFEKQSRLYHGNILQIIIIVIEMILGRFTENGYMYGTMLILAFGIVYVYRTKDNVSIQEYKCNKRWFMLSSVFFVWIRHLADLRLLNPLWYNPYIITHYYIDYNHYGFVQRGFIGTIFYYIFGYYISKPRMNLIIDIVYICAFLLVLLGLYCIGRNASEQNKEIVQSILLMVVISPALGGYMHPLIFQTIDIYNLLLCIVCIELLIRKKNVFLIPVLSIIGMLNHQIFVFLFFPMIFSVMLYQGFIGGQNKKRCIQMIFVITSLVVFGLFTYIQFFSAQRLKIDMDTAIRILKERTGGGKFRNMTLWKDVIFQDVSVHLNKFQNQISQGMVLGMIKSLIYFSPLIALYVYTYVQSIRKEEQKSKKVIYVVMMLSVLAILPCYILETDYFRWTTNLLFMLFMGILVLTIVQKNGKVWYSDINQNKLENWMLCIAIMLGCYQDMGFSVY